MKKFIKIKYLTALLLLVVMIPVHAASGSASLSAPGSVQVGETIAVTVSLNASEASAFDVTVSASGAASGSRKFVATESNSKTFYFSTHRAGRATISVSGEGSPLTSAESPFGVSGSTSVNVVAPSTGGGNSSGESSGSGSTGGGSTGNGSNGGSTGSESTGGGSSSSGSSNSGSSSNGSGGSSTSNSNNSTSNTQTPSKPESEMTEAEKAEKQLAEAKEAEAKGLLISKIDIVSTSEKQTGVTLQSMTPTEDIKDFEYTLPKRVDKFSVDAKAIGEDVTLTYDQNHVFEAGSDGIKEIPIRAVKGDLIQNYTLKVSKNSAVPIIKTIEKVNHTVLDDELLDDYAKEIGFTREAFKDGELDSFYYNKGKLKLQLLIDDAKNATWYTLDENNQLQKPVVLMLNQAKEVYVISEAPDAVHNKKIQNESYSEKELKADEKLLEIDRNLKFNTTYKSWDVSQDAAENNRSAWLKNPFTVQAEEAEIVAKDEIVYAADENGVFEYFKMNANGEMKASFLAFDTQSNGYQIWAYVSTGFAIVATGVAATLAYLLYMRNKYHKSKP